MEDSTQLFYQAGTLMLVGMGFVYGFLSLLIIVIKSMISPLASKYPDLPVADKTKKTSTVTNAQQSDSVIAAISAAVHRYRADQQTKTKR